MRPVPGRDRLADHPVGGGQLVQARGGQVGGHVEDLGGTGDQVGRGQVAVALAGRLGQGAGQPGPDPLRAAGGDAGRGGDRVRGLEPDPPHVRGQPARRLPRARNGESRDPYRCHIA